MTSTAATSPSSAASASRRSSAAPAPRSTATGMCVGTGGSGARSAAQPIAGQRLRQRRVLNFLDNMTNAVDADSRRPLRSASCSCRCGAPHRPERLHQHGGGYVFPNFPAPQPRPHRHRRRRRRRAATMNLVTAAHRRSDGRRRQQVPRRRLRAAERGADVDATGASTSATGGAYVAKFYSDPRRRRRTCSSPTRRTRSAGVQLMQRTARRDGRPVLRHLADRDRRRADGDQRLGAAIVAAPVTGSFPTFTGTGPAAMPITWETLPGGSAPGLVFVTRFHPACDAASDGETDRGPLRQCVNRARHSSPPSAWPSSSPPPARARADAASTRELFRPALDSYGIFTVDRAQTSHQWDWGFKLFVDYAPNPLRLDICPPTRRLRHRRRRCGRRSPRSWAGRRRCTSASTSASPTGSSSSPTCRSPPRATPPLRRQRLVRHRRTLARTGFYADAGLHQRAAAQRRAARLAHRLQGAPVPPRHVRPRRSPPSSRCRSATTRPSSATAASPSAPSSSPTSRAARSPPPSTSAPSSAPRRSCYAPNDPAADGVARAAARAHRRRPRARPGRPASPIASCTGSASPPKLYGLVPLVAGGAAARSTPASDFTADVVGGFQLFPVKDITVGVGAGAGLIGSAARHDDFRVFGGISWAPAEGKGAVGRPAASTPTATASPTRGDLCPTEPEDKDGFDDEDGCPDPDNDQDGIPDKLDKCPNEPEDKDGFQDDDGCPEVDNDGDGIPDAQDKCPNDPEDKDGFQDDDGCPDLDNDGDGIPDAHRQVPERAGDAQRRRRRRRLPRLGRSGRPSPAARSSCPRTSASTPARDQHRRPLATRCSSASPRRSRANPQREAHPHRRPHRRRRRRQEEPGAVAGARRVGAQLPHHARASSPSGCRRSATATRARSTNARRPRLARRTAASSSSSWSSDDEHGR